MVLGAALRSPAPIIALHLTRPPIEIPDRAKLGIPSHFAAAQGAYIVRDYQVGKPRDGAIIVQGTSAMVGIIQLLPDLEKIGLNVKIICAVSSQLFRAQSEAYRRAVISPGDQANSTVISTQSRFGMHHWMFNKISEQYAMTADWDNRWRTGGTVDEVLDEGRLTPKHLLEGIRKFALDKAVRMKTLRDQIDAA